MAALLAVAVSPLVHELGHVLGGCLAGFRLVLLVWGPFRVEREADRIRIAGNRHLALAGGIALCIPPATVRNPRAASVAYFGGGPVLSLGTGILACALAWTLGMPERGTVGGWAAAAFGIASLGLAVVTLIPRRSGGLMSDGARLLRALRNREAAQHDLCAAALVGLVFSPLRPRDWPRFLIDAATPASDPSPGTAVHLGIPRQFALYWHALDTGKGETARDHLQQALFACSTAGPLAGLLLAELALEAAFFELVIRHDLDRCRQWLERAKKASDRRWLRILQAIAADSGQPEQQSSILTTIHHLASRSGIDAARAAWLADFVARCPEDAASGGTKHAAHPVGFPDSHRSST